MICCLLSGSPAQDSHSLHFIAADKSVQLKPADAMSGWWPSDKFQASPANSTGNETLSLEAASVNSGTTIDEVYKILYLGAEMAISFVFVGCSDPMVTRIKRITHLIVDTRFRLHTISKIKSHNDWEEPKQILGHYATYSALCIYNTEFGGLRKRSKWLPLSIKVTFSAE